MNKKPPQNSDPILLHLAGVALHPAMQKVLHHPSSEATQGMLQAGREIVAERRVRDQEKEELIQEEVRRSAQNVRWTKGALPSTLIIGSTTSGKLALYLLQAWLPHPAGWCLDG